MAADNALPDQIVESIAIVNAKCIGEQPAIFSNLALANQVFNTNLQQQMMMSQSQAMGQITMATVARCISLVTAGDSGSASEAHALSEALNHLLAAMKPQPVKTPPAPPEGSKSEDTNAAVADKETGPPS
jgi:hypothetical protein